ncbi:MAG: DNA polymerase III subunit gamma/tau [Actinomycetota bacterium]
MAYLSLYRKYRPQTFDEILGQEHVSRTLANAISEDRVAHAYLFTGPRGTGKTSTARILAKALNCEQGPTPNPCGKCPSCVAITEGSSLDVIEMDAASHSKVDETREILSGVPLATAGSRKKVYVIDEVHMLSTGSFNALLKTLEEPPGHVIFVLATTESHKVLPTIVSRTQRFDFRRVPTDAIEGNLAEIAKLENIDVEPEALALVARHADGSVRDAQSILDQLASIGGHASVTDVERLFGGRSEDALFVLFGAIADGDVATVFTTVNSLVSQGEDVRQLALAALGHARSLMLLKAAPDASGFLDVSDEDRTRLSDQSMRFAGGTLLRVLDLIGNASAEMKNAPNHRLLLEVALVRCAAPETDPSAGGLLSRIARLERRVGLEETTPESDAAPPARTKKAAPVAKAAPPGETAPREEPAPPASAEQVPSDRVGLNHVKDAWSATLGELSARSKRVAALLNPSRPIRFDGDVLVVKVQSKFHTEEMAKEANRDMLAEALHAALGIRPPLGFADRDDADAVQESSEEDSAEDATDYVPLAEAEETQEEDPVEVVKKSLGAEVVKEIGDR